MDVTIASGTNCVKLASLTFPLNTLGINDKSHGVVEIFNSIGKTIFEEEWTSFKNSTNQRYADKSAVLAALEAALYGPIA